MPTSARSSPHGVAPAHWLALWALVLSIGWLLPNRTPPWGAFHQDAWIALSMLLMALLVCLRGDVASAPWTSPVVVCLALATVPWLQYVGGQVVLAGTAWLPSLYMLGLALALRIGTAWETAAPGEPTNTLFGAIVFAALVSTGLALSQWLGLDLGYWVIETGKGRPYANLGQPNQLGTFLAWGLVGLTWLWSKRHIGAGTWVFASMFVLFGIALTSSRTPWLILVALIALVAHWRQHFPRKPLVLGGGMLVIWFAISHLAIPEFSAALQVAADAGTDPEQVKARILSELRPTIWAAYVDAALRSPWWGYGWGQASIGQMNALLDHPDLQFLSSHAHNQFLDLVIWLGIPLGLAVSAFLVWRFWRLFVSTKTPDQALLFCLLMAVAIHAMLELPLHYAYMLLPAGFAWGILEAHQPGWQSRSIGKRTHIGVWAASVLLTILLAKDYVNVQNSYQWLRFEWARLATEKTAPVPNVLMLTQWSEFVKLSHRDLGTPAAPDEFKRIENLALLFPSSGFLMQLAALQALNDQPDEAQKTIARACQLNGKTQCRAIRFAWSKEALKQPALARVQLQ